MGGVVFQSAGISNEKINWPVISGLNVVYGPGLNIGKDRFPDFMKAYNEQTGQDLSGSDFLKEVFDTLEINSTLINMVGADSDIIIVSDNYRENIEYISKRYDFASWAMEQYYSFDYEIEKANPAFFERLLKDLGEVDLNQLIFIDDSPKKIESARKHGIEGILFVNNEQVRLDLEKRN